MRLRWRLALLGLPGLLALPSVGLASDCVAACRREAAACEKQAAADVAACRATVRERCGAACACGGLTGAETVACAQRCQICKDMQREGAGLDCDGLERDRSSECEQAKAACERRCAE